MLCARNIDAYIQVKEINGKAKCVENKQVVLHVPCHISASP